MHASLTTGQTIEKDDVANDRWVHFLDHFEPESPECLPGARLRVLAARRVPRVNSPAAEWTLGGPGREALANQKLFVPSDILDFFEQAAQVAACTPMFRGPDNWNEPWSLEDLPDLPPPRAMIEFVPGAPWADIDARDGWRAGDNPFIRWREAIRPMALELEEALGEPVYHFADLDCDTDDDDVHRFLVLHWCCTHKPGSTFALPAEGQQCRGRRGAQGGADRPGQLHAAVPDEPLLPRDRGAGLPHRLPVT